MSSFNLAVATRLQQLLVARGITTANIRGPKRQGDDNYRVVWGIANIVWIGGDVECTRFLYVNNPVTGSRAGVVNKSITVSASDPEFFQKILRHYDLEHVSTHPDNSPASS